MSVRTHFPSAKEPESHFFFTVSRGGRQKRFALRPGVLYGLVGGLPLIGAIYLGATAYMFFRDDNGDASPTRKGVTLNGPAALELASALDRAVQALESPDGKPPAEDDCPI